MPSAKTAVQIPFVPTEKQTPFVQSTAKYHLGGGSRGGGKSHCGVGTGLLLSFLIPGNTGYMGRANLTDFEKTTLPLLLAMVPKELLLTHNSQKHFIDILSCDGVTPSRIWYGEMKDPTSLLSGNLGWFYIDEAYEVPLETFVHLSGCLRGPSNLGKARPYYGLLTTNPAPGWVMDLFPVHLDELELYTDLAKVHPDLDWEPVRSPVNPKKFIDPDYAYFPFSAVDNPHNGAGYVAQLTKSYGLLGADQVARYVHGVWEVITTGLVYDLREEHIWNKGGPSLGLYRPGTPVLLGGDPSNGAGVYGVVAVQVWRGRLLIIDEFHKLGGTDEDFRDWLLVRPWRGDLEDGIFDPAKPDTITRLVSWGIPVRGLTRKKNVSDQVQALKAKMAVAPNGNTEFIIDGYRCPKLIEEFQKRVYRGPSRRNPDLRVSEQPVKAWDHLLNGLEYLIYQLFPFGVPLTGTAPVVMKPRERPAYLRLA